MSLPTTPFQSQLGTNYAPSETELSQISEILRSVDVMETQLSIEMEALKAKQAAFSSFAAAHRALASPIRRVPPDVLINIFLICMESNTDKKMSFHEAPLLLTDVCHRWREIVINTPSLWSQIHIRVPAYPIILDSRICFSSAGSEEEAEEALLDVANEEEAATALERWRGKWEAKIAGLTNLARLWLERGEQCPLFVLVTISDPAPEGNNSTAELLALICGHVSRWTHLDIYCSGSIPFQIRTIDASHAPQLRSVSVRWRVEYGTSTADPVTPVLPPESLMMAPSFLSLFIHDYPGGPIHRFPVRWETLVELSLSGLHYQPNRPALSPSIALAVLRKCPVLVKCELQLVDESLPAPTDASTPAPFRVLLPHLQRLVVFENLIQDSQQFFGSLDVPNLDSLALSSMGVRMYRTDTEPSFLPFLQKWGDRIHNLEFGRFALTVADFTKLIQLTPNIEELTVDLDTIQNDAGILSPLPFGTGITQWQQSQSFFKNDILRKFEVGLGNGSSVLCPRLQSLRLGARGCGDIAAKVIVSLANSRQHEAASCDRLESLIVRFATLAQGVVPKGQRAEPLRWKEVKLNAGFGNNVIRTQWPKVERAEHAPFLYDASPRSRGRAPFESWWDAQSICYSSHS